MQNFFQASPLYHDRVSSSNDLCSCCAQCSLTLFHLQQGTIVIIVPARTTEPVAISQIPINVLVIQDSLGKTVKVGHNEYSYNVSPLLF